LTIAFILPPIRFVTNQKSELSDLFCVTWTIPLVIICCYVCIISEKYNYFELFEKGLRQIFRFSFKKVKLSSLPESRGSEKGYRNVNRFSLSGNSTQKGK